MEIRKQLVKRNIAGDVILVPIGDTSLELQGLVILNETGELLWDHLPQAADASDLAAAMRAEYDVDEATACGTPRRFWSSCGSWTSFLRKTAGGTQCVPPAVLYNKLVLEIRVPLADRFQPGMNGK